AGPRDRAGVGATSAGIPHGVRTFSSTGSAVRSDRGVGRAAGGHGQDLAAPRPAGSARFPPPPRHGGRSDEPPGSAGEVLMTRFAPDPACEPALEALQRRLDGDPPHLTPEVETHLTVCADCRERFRLAG